MRILMIHNYYQQRGGEDESTELEVRLLQNHGHKVVLYSRHNREIDDFSPLKKSALFFVPSWSWRSYWDIQSLIGSFKPEIAHFQNIFPLISPSACYACSAAGVPIVQTLRNYRLYCPCGLFFRHETICEECLNHSPWHGIRYGCYRNSRIQTASVAFMLSAHRVLRTWSGKIDAYIALTEFSRHKFIAGGLPGSKIHVRPNFVEHDPGPGGESREFVLFVGRLSRGKGLDLLLEAWRSLPHVPLKIVGDGPLYAWARDSIREKGLKRVDLVGHIDPGSLMQFYRKALLLVMPSIWYETFGRTIIEAYAAGTPVVASRLGAMSELVEEGGTGLLFNPGDAEDLRSRIARALDHPAERGRWGSEARRAYEEQYSAERSYHLLTEIYRKTIADARK